VPDFEVVEGRANKLQSLEWKDWCQLWRIHGLSDLPGERNSLAVLVNCCELQQQIISMMTVMKQTM